MIHSRFRLRQCVLVPICLSVALFAVGQLLPATAASTDRPFLGAPDSPWDILGAFGFLMGISALGLQWRTRKAHFALLETIEQLDGKMRQQKTANDTSNMSRKTEIANLNEAYRQLEEAVGKQRDSLDRHRDEIPQMRHGLQQLSQTVEALKDHRNYIEASAMASSMASIELDGMAAPAVPNIDDCIAALNRHDKSVLRSKAKAELNITPESEDAIQRGSSGLNTQLRAVTGGGSYLLIERNAKHWLLPTVQTLSTFSVNQPQKGIFDYEREPVTVPELARAAELEAVEGTWEVVRKGVVIVPA